VWRRRRALYRVSAADNFADNLTLAVNQVAPVGGAALAPFLTGRGCRGGATGQPRSRGPWGGTRT